MGTFGDVGIEDIAINHTCRMQRNSVQLIQQILVFISGFQSFGKWMTCI